MAPCCRRLAPCITRGGQMGRVRCVRSPHPPCSSITRPGGGGRWAGRGGGGGALVSGPTQSGHDNTTTILRSDPPPFIECLRNERAHIVRSRRDTSALLPGYSLPYVPDFIIFGYTIALIWYTKGTLPSS